MSWHRSPRRRAPPVSEAGGRQGPPPHPLWLLAVVGCVRLRACSWLAACPGRAGSVLLVCCPATSCRLAVADAAVVLLPCPPAPPCACRQGSERAAQPEAARLARTQQQQRRRQQRPRGEVPGDQGSGGGAHGLSAGGCMEGVGLLLAACFGCVLCVLSRLSLLLCMCVHAMPLQGIGLGSCRAQPAAVLVPRTPPMHHHPCCVRAALSAVCAQAGGAAGGAAAAAGPPARGAKFAALKAKQAAAKAAADAAQVPLGCCWFCTQQGS